MARSRRKPYRYISGCRSEKEDKQRANRKFRRTSKVKIHAGNYDELFTKTREISNIWRDFVSEGKVFIDEDNEDEDQEKYLRK